MIIGNLIGGLGNQMFQYACARALAEDLNLPLKFAIDGFNIYKAHNGLEINKVFKAHIEGVNEAELANYLGFWRCNPMFRQVISNRYFSWLSGRHFISEYNFNYQPNLTKRSAQGAYLHGYWQSERYFSHHEKLIRSDFIFREKMNTKNQELAKKICKTNSISIHIRRGDYTTNSKTLATHGICSLNYYDQAINTILKQYPDAQFFVFSDDFEWVNENFASRYANITLVSHNKGVNSYNDMQLMSMCKHHIIANSSFSWWGAWLNPRKDKTVIAPAHWFADGRNTQDLIPNTWIRM